MSGLAFILNRLPAKHKNTKAYGIVLVVLFGDIKLETLKGPTKNNLKTLGSTPSMVKRKKR